MAKFDVIFRSDTKVTQGDGVEWFALGFHDIRQFYKARHIQTQVSRDDSRKIHGNGFQTAIHFAGDRGFAVAAILNIYENYDYATAAGPLVAQGIDTCLQNRIAG